MTLIRAFPNGEAVSLLSKLGWQCAYCAVSAHEPLSLAAKRHGVAALPVIRCFRAMFLDELEDEMISRAKIKVTRRKDTWISHIV